MQDMEQLSDVVLGAVWPHAYSTVYYRIWWALSGLMPIALYIIGYGGPYFCRIWNSYLTLFWALFGLMPIALYIIGYGGPCLASCQLHCIL